jgi:hypothetical protein
MPLAAATAQPRQASGNRCRGGRSRAAAASHEHTAVPIHEHIVDKHLELADAPARSLRVVPDLQRTRRNEVGTLTMHSPTTLLHATAP